MLFVLISSRLENLPGVFRENTVSYIKLQSSLMLCRVLQLTWKTIFFSKVRKNAMTRKLEGEFNPQISDKNHYY